VTIDAGSAPSEAKSLQVRGTATVEIVDGIPDEYLAGSRKSSDAEQAETFERAVRSMYRCGAFAAAYVLRSESWPARCAVAGLRCGA
jgi:hypothetical protein